MYALLIMSEFNFRASVETLQVPVTDDLGGGIVTVVEAKLTLHDQPSGNTVGYGKNTEEAVIDSLRSAVIMGNTMRVLQYADEAAIQTMASLPKEQILEELRRQLGHLRDQGENPFI